jgi:hypothetical protein
LALLSEGIDLIKLYKALGGGWEHPTSRPHRTTPLAVRGLFHAAGASEPAL